MPSADYEAAKVEVKFLSKEPGQFEMLDLYALAKVAESVDIKSRPAPGMFDFAEKEKRKAWQKLLDSGLTPDQAEKKYIETVEELKTKYGTRDLTDADKKLVEEARAKGTA